MLQQLFPRQLNARYFEFLKPFIFFVISVLLLLSLSRLVLMAWQYDRVEATSGLGYILLQGVRFDLVLLGLLLVVPATLAPVMQLSKKLQAYWHPLLTVYLSICFIAVLFVELSTPSFINQYDLRPNVLYVEYLKYPREVFATLWEAYRFQLIATTIISAVLFSWFYKKVKKMGVVNSTLSLRFVVLAVPVLFLITVMMARSTLGHRAVNPSTVAFSTDPLVNTLPLSSAYSVLYAIREMNNEDGKALFYAKMDEVEALSIVEKEMHVDPKSFIDSAHTTLHHQVPEIKREKPLNLVIILEESLGAEFVGALGGLPLTPNLDRLSAEGIWFSNLYATGTRSVRGIEAVVTGFTPTPLRSVVKLSKSQTGFFTIANLLKSKGFETSFIYGGEAHFDNMKRFFANNGFDHIIDEDSYESPVFTGSWGVSDEDLFTKAHQTFSAYKKDQPFFSLVFTSSNHEPFEFPDNRIENYDETKQTVNNAVKYADYALGKFIEQAKQSDYWENTLFLVVADHNSRVYGNELVPVERFHIPALILGGAVQSGEYARLASQIDLLPTVLSIMGVESDHPAIGRDLTRRDLATLPGRAIMQFADTQAYMTEDNKVVVMEKNKQPAMYQYVNKHLQPATDIDSDLIKKAIAHSVWSLIAYQNKLYH